ncbi:hypothetical protein GBF38_018887 [Nibea albiflora]|uniref:Uncharacterized protein n=1 Tax=Nibea albiflora TaxID=240163 RepID=A0ACB7ENM8_NIBAL|nr:hypothetical protein GBF38_018887 [Nibea albiflora]
MVSLDERVPGCSKPPSHRPPSFPSPPAQSPAQLEALSLTSPSLSVNTFALWLALSPLRHTPASAWFGREKAL